VPKDLLVGEVKALRSRKITEQTCQHFGYKTGEYKGKAVQIAPYYNADGQQVAQKLRRADKTFLVLGEIKDALPFGAHVWPKSGKMLVVTEGEIDALAVSQVQGNKWPVVSISCGADKPEDAAGNALPMNGIRRYFAKHKEYFSQFEKVVLMFDNDAPGRASARAAAEVLGSRARIAELPLKDAGEMVEQGRAEELIRAMWNAVPYRPEGIVDLHSLKGAIKQRPQRGLSWCLETLTALTYGKRLGEIVAVAAGTGVGKTDFLTQDMLHMVREHREKIGVFALEQQNSETGIRLIGKAAERPLHIPEYWDDDIFDATWEQVVSAGQVFLYDSFGVNQWESIKSKIEYLYHAEGVQYFYLDHLTALAAAEEDERKGLEAIMADMGGLVKAIPIHITLVSHLATPEGKPHEEGGRVMIRHFKGSRAIGFWSHYMFGLERDQQAADPEVRGTTTFRVLKDRYTGRAAGATFFLGYDHETGMLYERPEPGAEPAAAAYGFENNEQGGTDF
jgi:twinkle protein